MDNIGQLKMQKQPLWKYTPTLLIHKEKIERLAGLTEGTDLKNCLKAESVHGIVCKGQTLNTIEWPPMFIILFRCKLVVDFLMFIPTRFYSEGSWTAQTRSTLLVGLQNKRIWKMAVEGSRKRITSLHGQICLALHQVKLCFKNFLLPFASLTAWIRVVKFIPLE